ncbi:MULTISPECIES: hypothetical protein [unclassified Actinoplanes]|uniref:hypothetical protein n=1 Tax=unclassified Actinoplanes TaxID=2626549 RepID=UPI000301B68C|nr:MULTISPECIES: hypothetical protein [unclassified Actinoplanes]
MTMPINLATAGSDMTMPVNLAASGTSDMTMPINLAAANADLTMPVNLAGANADLTMPVNLAGANADLTMPVHLAGANGDLTMPVNLAMATNIDSTMPVNYVPTQPGPAQRGSGQIYSTGGYPSIDMTMPVSDPSENSGSLTGHILAQGWHDAQVDQRRGNFKVIVAMLIVLGLLVTVSLVFVLTVGSSLSGMFKSFGG